MSLKFAIITCSDTRDLSQDEAGAALADLVRAQEWEVLSHEVTKDEKPQIGQAIKTAAAAGADVIITCGGTGLSPRDVTPEATREVCDREVPGIAEAMRAYSMTKTRRAMLSRATAAQLGATLVVNFPGSKKAAIENWEGIFDQFEHAISMAHGGGHDHHGHHHGHGEHHHGHHHHDK